MGSAVVAPCKMRIVPIDPRTPVVVGAAATQRRDGDPATAPDAIALIVAALEAAAADCGAPALLRRVDLVLVPKGSWSWSNPGRLVAEAIGTPAARTVRAEIGVLQHTLLARAADAVASGAAVVVAVCGGEARWRAAQAARAGVSLVDATAPAVAEAGAVISSGGGVVPPEPVKLMGVHHAISCAGDAGSEPLAGQHSVRPSIEALRLDRAPAGR